jgi:glycosyltransferase involved in cell wall biosynthesis
MIKGLGSFTLIKNEGLFIKAHLDSWLPHLAQMVFFDGNSTDGTLEIIKQAQQGEFGSKIKLFENKDPKNLEEDYTKLSNECMWSLDTDFATFLHPDMFYVSGGANITDDAMAATMNMKSYAGEPNGIIYEIKGRGEKWKNIYRLRNPNMGAHYFGTYGAQNEDTYFSEITGDCHEHYGQSLDLYPYNIYNSNLLVAHYSDVRPLARRLDRMTKCLINQGYTPEQAKTAAPLHPRVSFKEGQGFSFIPVEVPVFLGEKLEV